MRDAAPPSFVSRLEESLIALTLGLMTLVTFANVVARYGFNSNILWALEVTSVLFAWLVLLGISYCVKINAHLGVDAVTSLLSAPVRRAVALLAGFCCLAYALLLLKGGWDFWANFANLPATTGRWFPTGFEQNFLAKGWYETNDIEMPAWLAAPMAEWFNEGERYEKMPRLVPYMMLPLGFALLSFRLLQAFVQLWRGQRQSLIVSHEVEDAIDEIRAKEGR